MKRSEGIAYLTQCADAEGKHWHGGYEYPADECPTCEGTNRLPHASVPCSRYGRTSAECAPVAWRLAYVMAEGDRSAITPEALDGAMSLVVNEHPDVATIIREHGNYRYR